MITLSGTKILISNPKRDAEDPRPLILGSPPPGLFVPKEKVNVGSVIYIIVFCRYFPSIYNMSGCEENRQKFGSFFDYNECPRAQIFRRDQHKVTDLNTMMKLMRYTNI